MKGKVYRGGSLLLESPGPFFPIRSTRTLSRVEEWRPMLTNSPRQLLPAAFYQSAVGFTRWPLPALFSCRWFMPARVRHARHDAFLFPFRDARPGSAFDDSLLESDSIFAKRRRAEEPLHRITQILLLLSSSSSNEGRFYGGETGLWDLFDFFPLFSVLQFCSSSLDRFLLRIDFFYGQAVLFLLRY